MVRVCFTLLLTLSLGLAGCGSRRVQSKNPPPAVQKQWLTTPMQAAIGALTELQKAAAKGEWANAKMLLGTYMAAYEHVQTALPDAAARDKLNDAVSHLEGELAKQAPQQAAVSTGVARLQQLLSEQAQHLGIPIARQTTTDQPGAPVKVIPISMHDFRYEPSVIQVAKGTRVTLKLKNAGKETHELEIKALDVEAEDIPPGGTAEVTFVATKAGRFEMACHEPGHYEAGMKGTLEVR